MKWLVVLIFTALAAQRGAAQADTNPISIRSGLPAYLRQGDHTELRVWLENNADHEITGQVQLELIDSLRKQSVDGWFLNTFPNQYFTVAAGKSEEARFPVQVPMQYANGLLWRISVAWDSSRVQATGSLSILPHQGSVDKDSSAPNEEPVQLSKNLFMLKRNGRVSKSIPVEQQIALQVGDTIEVHLKLHTTAGVNQVHIIDGLAAGTGFLADLSKNTSGQFEQKPNLTSVEFFLKQVKKGTHTIRYFLLVTTAGNFSTGNTKVEFSNPSQPAIILPGQTLNVE